MAHDDAPLTPELYCSDLQKSLAFYCDVLGFHILYDRPEDGFAMLERDGARIMLEQIDESGRTWCTGDLDYPLGRGVNFQIKVSDVQTLYDKTVAVCGDLFLPLEDKWYRAGDKDLGNRQFIVQDPDGYLLRFFEDLGTKERETCT
jgi:catechol 2,3-dioxygenase-like lactoylglutathione lyase family enzyme